MLMGNHELGLLKILNRLEQEVAKRYGGGEGGGRQRELQQQQPGAVWGPLLEERCVDPELAKKALCNADTRRTVYS
jgi:hypothetical protein